MSTDHVEEQASAPQDPAPAPVAVDFDRVLAGDEAYAKEAAEQLAAELPQSDEKAEEAPKGDAGAEPAQAKPALDPDEVVETITYRGEEIPVKRSQMKDLLQKGRHLEVRLEEVSPYLALQREVPDLADKLRTPEGRRQIVERIRREETAKQAEVPEVEGYDKDDVAAVDKIVAARLKALGITPKEPVNPEAEKADKADMMAKSRIMLESLQTLDPHYEENIALLKTVVQEIERSAPPEKFREFFRVVNDPRVIDPATGRPAFLNFYNDVNKERLRRASLNQPAAPVAVPAIPRKVQASTTRMAPGAAISPSSPAGVKDFASLPQSEFDRAFAEALARG